jgi:hypothetical protein
MGPSLAAFELYEPTSRWGFGLAGSLSRDRWTAVYTGPDGQRSVTADLMMAFVGGAARYVAMPTAPASLVVDGSFGGSFQLQSGSNFNCNDGFAPTAELGIGASWRLTDAVSLVVRASGRATVRTSGGCAVSDGPPATPFAGFAYALQIGVSFELPLLHGRPRVAPED